MDLRANNPNDAQLAKAKELVKIGMMGYQPFIFSDQFETGVGYEFHHGAEGAGFVYDQNLESELFEGVLKRNLISHNILLDFRAANSRLRITYESFLNLVEEKVGNFSDLTFAEVGCNTGYFPIGASLRGSPSAIGYDATNYEESLSLLSEITGSNARFQQSEYNPRTQELPNMEMADIVFSVAVLVHLSDPLQHLALLGRMAKKAILVWTLATDDDEDGAHILNFISQKYSDREFPETWDVVAIAPGLLRRSFELMGFTEIYRIKDVQNGMGNRYFDVNCGYLAIRPD